MSSRVPRAIGRYRILGELGRGAMGIVYKAVDDKLERTVAIKTVLVTQETEEANGYLARFRQEAKALGALNHPSIITVHEFGDEGDLAYMVMELVEGREVRQLVQRGPMAPAAAAEVVAQVAEGLAYAHAHGIVHRDVKPSNIMVLEGNRAKVMDFGIARVRASDVKTQTGFLLGSPKYMSPEQVVGRPLDGRTDVFSLGAVLHEMLTGKAPFSGADVHHLMFEICNGRTVKPSEINPAIPEVLDLIVAKALEKDVELRYADAAAFAADLRACLEALPREAPPSGVEVTQQLAAPGAVSDRTVAATVALGSRATSPVGSALGLAPWRRFESSRALQRLAAAHGDDRALLAPERATATRWQLFKRDPELALRAAAIAGAALLALLIVAY